MQISPIYALVLCATATACGNSEDSTTANSAAGSAGSAGVVAASGASGNSATGTAGHGGVATGGGAGSPQLLGGAGAGGGSVGMAGNGGGGAMAGSGGDAGTAGSAGAGAGGAPSLGGCSLRKYQLCDDFEGAAPGTNGSVWTVRNGFPTDVVTDVVHSGSHAVRVTANGQGSGGIQEKQILPAKDYWLRVYVRLDAANTQHEGFVVANGQPESFRLLNNPGGKGGVMLDRTSNDQGWEISNTTTLPKASWHCWEWHETPTEIHTYLDGAEILDVLAKWPEPNITSLSFGFERYHDGGEGFIYYDDIVLDTTRIGCE